jgi:hypothetical protein
MHGNLQRSIRSGHYELVVMLALAGLSFLGAPALIIVAGAALLMVSTLYEYAHLQPRLVKAGATGLMAGGIFLTALTSLVFASLCYAVGRLFAWLIAA